MGKFLIYKILYTIYADDDKLTLYLSYMSNECIYTVHIYVILLLLVNIIFKLKEKWACYLYTKYLLS